MDLGQFSWLVPVALTLILTVSAGIFVYVAVDVPQGWQGSRAAFSFSHSAFRAP